MASISKKSQDAMLELEFNGEKLILRQSEITGIDSRDFRAELGFGVTGMFQADGRFLDVDSVAGVIWLIKRRTNPRLKFVDIAAKVTFADLNNIGEAIEDDDTVIEIGAADPFGSEVD